MTSVHTATPPVRRAAWGSPRRIRKIVAMLRGIAARAGRGVTARRNEVLLYHRAAAVRHELLELAALLESAEAPDQRCVAALHTLVTSGCDSPLYNWDIHESELRATLYYARAGLGRVAAG
ncbi:MAG TPA: hypothetical protein VHX62_11045 [Solirubrobacteraceae bacterium]|jgi:hypothetical protein|nr:hypothetical protein [Solirubrobacteraceae bacterium]